MRTAVLQSDASVVIFLTLVLEPLNANEHGHTPTAQGSYSHNLRLNIFNNLLSFKISTLKVTFLVPLYIKSLIFTLRLQVMIFFCHKMLSGLLKSNLDV